MMEAALHFSSPRRGEVGARSAAGEGVQQMRLGRTPSPNPLPAGERALRSVSSDEQLVADGFENAFNVRQHFVVPEAEESIAECLDNFRARCVDFRRMLSAIEFDREVRVAAGEVGDVRAYRKLPDEFGAFESTRTEVAPEPSLSMRAPAAQISRGACKSLFTQWRTPSSQPSPHWGEGVRSAPDSLSWLAIRVEARSLSQAERGQRPPSALRPTHA
jgi:hypothetical protein